MEVSTESLDRALQLADLPLRASESLGWNFVDVRPKPSGQPARRFGYQQPEPPSPAPKKFGELLVVGERVAFSIEGRYRDERRTPTDKELAPEKREYGYKAPRKVAVATGNLRVVRLDTYRAWRGPTRQSWYDRGNTKVEERYSATTRNAESRDVYIRVRLRRIQKRGRLRGSRKLISTFRCESSRIECKARIQRYPSTMFCCRTTPAYEFFRTSSHVPHAMEGAQQHPISLPVSSEPVLAHDLLHVLSKVRTKPAP
jgi:hypothetical protein